MSKECARKPGKKICKQEGTYDLNVTYAMPQKEETTEELCSLVESYCALKVNELFKWGSADVFNAKDSTYYIEVNSRPILQWKKKKILVTEHS